MDTLHTKHGIIHRDLKASNILLWSLGEGLPCNNSHVKANVVDYECSMGVVGSGFWRAPEILQQLKDGVPSSEVVFTKAADVYSFGMVCYELLYGLIPFEDLSQGFDVVLSGGRPQELPEGELLICNQDEARDYFRKLRLDLPILDSVPSVPAWVIQTNQQLDLDRRGRYYKWTPCISSSFASPMFLDSQRSVRDGLNSVMQLCWNHEPSERPTFSEIVELLESENLQTIRVRRFRIEDGREPSGYKYHVVKVVNGYDVLEHFRQQLPVINTYEDRVGGPLVWIVSGTSFNWFAFVMPTLWGSLRNLIDENRRYGRGPPRFQDDFLLKVILCIARDMDTLHTENIITSRDLKASNIILWNFGGIYPCDNPQVKTNVIASKYTETKSTFWEGPEILQQLKDGVQSSNLVFTKAANVYSYGMICYELLSGRVPFEGHELEDFDVVVSGGRPARLPEWEHLVCNEHEVRDFLNLRWAKAMGRNYKQIHDTFRNSKSLSSVKSGLFSVMQICWSHDPSKRPTFSEIVEFLESRKV